MSVGFGFSAGDFIAALELVATVIDALRESGNSSSEYRELISQLFTLETALIAVKRVELDDAQHAEVVALQQAAAQCQRTIDAFWEKIKKYQPSLRTGGSGSRVKDGWMKVKWALCKKEDIARFKADLVGHTESIEMLLTTVQMAATRIDSKKNDERHQTLAGRLQGSYFGCMQRIGLVLEQVSTGIQQGRQLLDRTAEIIQTNVQIFQILVSVQNIVTRIPGQVDRQQPVYFIDALGRHMVFHLEFVLSAEALTAVLRSNFRNVGRGAKKIERGEFVIQDAATKLDVDLTMPWEACFSPGQHAVMSMVFNSAKAPNMSCPTCHDDNGDNAAQDEDIECRKCKMVYRRSVSITSVTPSSQSPGSSSKENLDEDGKLDFSPDLPPNSSSRKRQRPHDEEKEMALFRRVRIKTEIKVVAVKSRNTRSRTRVDNDDPHSDPELLRMLEAERAHENELLVELRKSQGLEAGPELDIDAEGEVDYYDRFHEREAFEYQLYDELQAELENDVAVERELNRRRKLEEIPSDTDREDSEESENDDSDDSNDSNDSDEHEDDIDMDYRFS